MIGMHLRSFSDAPRTKQLKVKKKAKRSLEAESSSGIRDRLTDVMIRYGVLPIIGFCSHYPSASL